VKIKVDTVNRVKEMSTMDPKKINNMKLIRLIDSGSTQAGAARELGVSRQAVSQRLIELRGRTTKVMATKKIEQVVDQRLDAVEQLNKINTEANRLLDELEQTPELKLKVMAEIRGQLRLQLDIFQTLYDMQAVKEFQQEVLSAIGEADKETRNAIINKLNESRAIRSAVKFD
jgi:predicted transcriptional regulator